MALLPISFNYEKPRIEKVNQGGRELAQNSGNRAHPCVY